MDIVLKIIYEVEFVDNNKPKVIPLIALNTSKKIEYFKENDTK